MRVHGSQAYRKMDVTRERISCILELREIPLSFQTGTSPKRRGEKRRSSIMTKGWCQRVSFLLLFGSNHADAAAASQGTDRWCLYGCCDRVCFCCALTRGMLKLLFLLHRS